jgi:hypothetical protein
MGHKSGHVTHWGGPEQEMLQDYYRIASLRLEISPCKRITSYLPPVDTSNGNSHRNTKQQETLKSQRAAAHAIEEIVQGRSPK